MPEENLTRIRQLLESFDTALLVTATQHEPGRARPMAIARVEPDCGLWFFTGRETSKVHEIQQDSHVLIACQKDHSRYLSLRGRAELVADRSRALELWKETYRAWFPRGLDDPELMLIHVRPVEAEFWDNQGLKAVRYVFEKARALVRGERMEVEEGSQHGRVILE